MSDAAGLLEKNKPNLERICWDDEDRRAMRKRRER